MFWTTILFVIFGFMAAIKLPVLVLDLSCRWSWLLIFWHSWHGWLTSLCLFSWYGAGHSLLSLSFWFMWTHLLFYPQRSHYHLFSPLLSALTRHQLFSFQLTILYQCALFWIIFLAAVFDLAHGFSISTVLITSVFVFSLCHRRFMLFFSFLGDYSCICWCLSLPVMTLCFDFVLCFAQLFFGSIPIL